MLRTVRLSRAGILAARGYASTAAAPVAGASSQLSGIAAQAAQEVSSKWKGTSATGGNTMNYIDGKFVDSKATKWFDVHDPVSTIEIPNSAHPRSGEGC